MLRGILEGDEKVVIHKWENNHYFRIPNPRFKNEIQEFLTKKCAQYADVDDKKNGGLEQFPAYESIVGNVYKNIARRVYDEKATNERTVWLGEGEPPANPDNIFFCKNCIFNVQQGCVIPNSPLWFNTTTLAVNYNPETSQSCKTYLKFEERLTGGDAKKIKLLRQFSGLCLIDKTSMQKGLIIVGPSESGKTQYGLLLSGILGRPNLFSLDSPDFSQHFGLEEAIGKKLALLSDCRFTNNSNIQIAVERLLKLIGEDAIPHKEKYKKAKTVYLQAKVLMIMNTLVKLPDRTGALRRRFSALNVPDSAVLSLREKIDGIAQVMLDNEAEAILNLWVKEIVGLMAMKNPVLCKPDDEDELLDQFTF